MRRFSLSLVFIFLSHSSISEPIRPRVYVYDFPTELNCGRGWGTWLSEEIRKSKYHEPDPDKADYFWIPGGGWYGYEGSNGTVNGKEHLVSIFEHVKNSHPWWNQTVALGHARHVLVSFYDGGIGEAFDHPERDSLPSGWSCTLSQEYNGSKMQHWFKNAERKQTERHFE